MKKKNKKRGKLGVFVVPFKGVNVLAELDANSLMMSRYLWDLLLCKFSLERIERGFDPWQFVSGEKDGLMYSVRS